MNSIGTCGESSTQAVAARSMRRVAQAVDAFAEGAVADLVVRLQEGNEGSERQVRGRLAARLAVAKAGRLALVDEAFGQRAPEARHRRIGIVGVVAVDLAGDQHVRRMVDVVVPLRACRKAERRVHRARACEAWFVSFSSTTCTCRSRPGPCCSASQISRTMCLPESSRMAWIASMRRPSNPYSSTQ